MQVLSRDKSAVVGKISKQWSGLIREAFTDSDYFGISFPIDLDVRMKAVMLGACFLIVSKFVLSVGFELYGVNLNVEERVIYRDLVVFWTY